MEKGGEAGGGVEDGERVDFLQRVETQTEDERAAPLSKLMSYHGLLMKDIENFLSAINSLRSGSMRSADLATAEDREWELVQWQRSQPQSTTWQ